MATFINPTPEEIKQAETVLEAQAATYERLAQRFTAEAMKALDFDTQMTLGSFSLGKEFAGKAAGIREALAAIGNAELDTALAARKGGE